MAGQAQHVDVLGLYINVQMADGLYGIGMEGNAGILTNSADLSDGQHRADLIVGIHAGHQTGVLTNRILYLLCGHIVAVFDIQQGDLKAFFF